MHPSQILIKDQLALIQKYNDEIEYHLEMVAQKRKVVRETAKFVSKLQRAQKKINERIIQQNQPCKS